MLFNPEALMADDRTISIFGIEATLRAYLLENTALVFGFRLQGTNASAGEYERNGSVMGLVAGATIRF